MNKIINTHVHYCLEFLSYHVVDGLFYSNDLRDGQFLPTLLGEHEIQVGVRVDHCQSK